MSLKTVTKAVKGTKLKVNDRRSTGWKTSATVTNVVAGQLDAGAKFQDVTTDDGKTERCWEGFNYSILMEVERTILNSTPAELKT